MEHQLGKLTAQKRTARGKNEIGRLRRDGMLPAVLYGGKKESIGLVVDLADFQRAIDPTKKRNTVFSLTIQNTDGSSGESALAVLREWQVDALTQAITHADFWRVEPTQRISVRVPLRLDGRPEGVKMGGKLNQVLRDLPIECTPADIPALISIDVSGLNVADSVKVADLELAEGLSVKLPGDQKLAMVVAGRKSAETDESQASGDAATASAAS